MEDVNIMKCEWGDFCTFLTNPVILTSFVSDKVVWGFFNRSIYCIILPGINVMSIVVSRKTEQDHP